MTGITTIDPASISQKELHHYLLSAVAPRPICFASTIDKEGNVNLSPFSFFNVFSSNPPVMVFSPARRGRDSSNKDTYNNINDVRETVINIVNYDIVEQMSLSSTEYPTDANEFLKAGLTQVPSEKVKPPRVGEAPVSFECKVKEVIELGDGPGAGNLIIAHVVLMHINEAYLDDNGKLDTPKLDLVARMGGSWYCRATGDALFEIPKPIRTKGVGVDQIPQHIRESDVLTGNNLGRLGNVEQLPSIEAINSLMESQEVQSLVTRFKHQHSILHAAIHHLAKEWIEMGRVDDALALLLGMESIR